MCQNNIKPSTALRYPVGLLFVAALNTVHAQVLEEVVVTAQKRSQSLQDVPIALNAFNADFLQTSGAQNLSALQQFTPGLVIEAVSVTQPTFSIRGIGSNALSIGTDAAVGVYNDGIYVGRSASSNVEFSDIDRVEVLKGPQGTLFGRNAAAGAINIITRKPVHEQEGYVRVRLGNYDKVLGEAALNTILIDETLAARFNLIGNHRDGYINNALGGNDFGDEQYYAGRASFLWTPGAETSVRYSLDYNRLNQGGPVAIGLNPEFAPTGTRGGEIGDVDVFGPVANDVFDDEERRKQIAHSVTWEQQLDGAKMTFIGSYLSFDSNVNEDEDGLGLLAQDPPVYFLALGTENIEKNKQLYSELRLSGGNDSVSWATGVSLYGEDGQQALEVTANVGTFIRNLTSDPVTGEFSMPDEATCLALSGLALGQAFPCNTPDVEIMLNEAETRSVAAFGDITWQINDYFGITAGARITYDDKKFAWFNPPNSLTGNPADDVIFSGDASPESALAKQDWVRRQGSWDNFDPRIVLNFYPQDDIMLWASYANGYTTGGFNSLQVGSEFEPEEVDNYELGIKSELLDNTLRINASVYHYRYADKQDILQIDTGGAVRAFSTVTGDAKGTGFEAEVVWLPAVNFQLGLNYGYLDSEWTDRQIEGFYDGCGAPRRSGNLKGESIQRPEQRLALMLDYDLTLGDAGALKFHIDHSVTDEAPRHPASADFCVNYETKDDDYKLTNARITWVDSSASWKFAVWAENLLDTEQIQGFSNSAEDLGAPYVRRQLPRMYGVELIYNW